MKLLYTVILGAGVGAYLTKYIDSSKRLYISGKSNKIIGAKGRDNPRSKKIIQLTLNNEPIKIWDSIREVGRYGFSSSPVGACCRGKRKTHKGFKWMYLSDYEKMIK